MKSLCQSIKNEHGQSRVVHCHVGRFGGVVRMLECSAGVMDIAFPCDEHLPFKNCINRRFDEERGCTLRRAARSGRLYQQQVACPARLEKGCLSGTLSSDMLFKMKIVL